MSADAPKPEYQHIQRSKICWILYAMLSVYIFLAVAYSDTILLYVFGSASLFTAVLASSFHYLAVESTEESLKIHFGPLPLFRKTLKFSDIQSVRLGRTTIIDGWGIHRNFRGETIWNIWGRDCVIVEHQHGILKIGSSDSQNLADFLTRKTSPQ